MSTYTVEQIHGYLDHIGLPIAYRKSPLETGLPAPTQKLLFALHAFHISSCPYENLSIHYSPAHNVSLEPQRIYNKIVVNKRGRGGYCMENSLLFHHILKGLGYTVYTAPAKRRPRLDGLAIGDYIGWVHIVNIVILINADGVQRKFASDVAFGGDGARCPLELVEGIVTHNLGTQQIRLSNSYLPAPAQNPAYTTSTLSTGQPATKFWNYQYKNKETDAWGTFYSFPEFEFSHSDFEIMNFWTSTSPDSHQTTTILAIRFLRDEEGNIVGKRTLVNDTVKQFPTAAGLSRTEVVEVFTSEKQRVEGLKRWFNLTLTEEEQNSIKGWKTELKENAENEEQQEKVLSPNDIIKAADNTG